MRITRVELVSYRNYARAELLLSPGVTALWGDNAQGKTNCLEAVYLCCTGRSHRTARDRDLIMWGQEKARVRVDAERLDGSHQVEIELNQNERKQVKVNGKPVSRSGELLGHVTGVLFSPEDLKIVKDGPSERRRFIDMELSQLRPSYYYQLQRYNRALRQRGQLLREGGREKALLDSWDEMLAISGAEIISHRRAFIRLLHGEAARVHTDLTGSREALTLSYQPSVSSDADGKALSEAIYLSLESARENDIRRGITSVGPHRDDLLIALGGVDARSFGSQGQQRSCALSLKLAEWRVMEKELHETPILMLDDVLSELDPGRRRRLLKLLGGAQTLITCTDVSDLAGAPVSLEYKISSGSAQSL